MRVGDLGWYGLVNVAVFGDLAVLEPEDLVVAAWVRRAHPVDELATDIDGACMMVISGASLN